jgi:hypothetical protein
VKIVLIETAEMLYGEMMIVMRSKGVFADLTLPFSAL